MRKTMIAEELNGQHIDNEVTFQWEFTPSLVKANVFGVLREVHHDAGDEVVLWLTGLDCDTGDKSEFIVPRGAYVELVENK